MTRAADDNPDLGNQRFVTPFGAAWIGASSTAASFFRPGQQAPQPGDQERPPRARGEGDASSSARISIVFDLPYPAVYRMLSFLDVHTTLRGFYPACHGFAELLQSLSRGWWAERMLLSAMPRFLTEQMQSAAQLALRERVMVVIRDAVVSNTNNNNNNNGDATDLNNTTVADFALAANYFERRAACSRCHLPVAARYLLRDPDRVFLEGEARDKSAAYWVRRYGEVRAFAFRGCCDDGVCAAGADASAVPVAAAAVVGDTGAAAGAVGGLLVAFKWSVSADARKPAASGVSGGDDDDDDGKRFQLQCPECHVAAGLEADFADPLHVILPDPLANALEREALAAANDEDDDDDHGSAVAGGEGDCRNHRAHQPGQLGFPPAARPTLPPALLARLAHRHASSRHEAEYWGLLSCSVVVKCRTYDMHGERKRAVVARVVNPLTLGSVELYWFMMYRMESFARFYCQLLALRNHNFTADVLEGIHNDDSTAPRQVFHTGYGRVEVEKPPRIFLGALLSVAASLGLSDDFPLALLWNVLAVASGLVVDLLPHLPDTQLMHSLRLRNLFDECVAE